MPRRSVVHLTTSDMGMRYLLLDQLRYLADQGYDVSAVSADGPHLSALRAAGIAVRTVNFTRRISPAQDAFALAQLVTLFRRMRPDLVHTHSPKASLLGQWAARVAGVPRRVHTIHGLYLPADARGVKRRLYLWLERSEMASAHIVLSQNAEDIATATRERLCDPERLRLLGNGIDVERFHPRNQHGRDEVRRRLGIPNEHLVVGMIGRLVREKGYPELFEAAVAIRGRINAVTFVVVGGPEPSKPDAVTAEDVDRWALGDSLLMLGHRDDIAELLGAMDVVVLPSHREGFPRVLMEAAATGLPVVATDIRGCRDAVVDGETGILVPRRDPAALATAILRVLEDAPLRERLGTAGRRLAQRRFAQQEVFARVLQAYRDLGL
jgi:glycosyltransferase involved in cell wall biosynthesis